MLARPLSCLWLASLASAQEVVWDRDGVRGQYHFDFPLGAVVVGDLDGDGWEDAVVIVDGIPNFATELWFLSGRDGRTLRRRPQYAPLDYYSVVARTGDLSGDGVPDYVFSTSPQHVPYQPIVEIASGVDDTPIWSVQGETSTFGSALLGDLDLDGDGKRDLVVSQPVHPTLRYHAYDNAGRPLYTIPIQPDLEFYRNPLSVARLGDLDGDGADEWVAGGFDATGNGAIVFSGRTGAIHLRALSTRLDAIGTTVRGTGDLDGDGVPDLMTASNFGGTVVAFSGRTGSELRAWLHESGAFGIATPDVDRDGVCDVLVGLANLQTGTIFGAVIAYSGRDGGELLRSSDGGRLGVRIEPLRGPDDGSFPMFLTPMPQAPLFGDGRVRVYRATPRTVAPPVGAPCVGGLGAPPEIGLRDLTASGGRGVRVHLSAAPPGVSTCLVLGLSNTDWGGVPLPWDLSFLGLPAGCALHTSVDAFAARTTGTAGLDRGFAFVDLPFDVAMLGRRVYAQWLLFGPGNTWPGGLTRPLSWQLAL